MMTNELSFGIYSQRAVRPSVRSSQSPTTMPVRQLIIERQSITELNNCHFILAI